MADASRSFLLVALLAAGCSQPELGPSFESGVPPERTMAAAEAARAGDTSKIPHLISMLSSSDPAERMIAADALRRLTGQTQGYEFADPEPRRREAIARWRAWFESGGGAAEGGAS